MNGVFLFISGLSYEQKLALLILVISKLVVLTFLIYKYYQRNQNYLRIQENAKYYNNLFHFSALPSLVVDQSLCIVQSNLEFAKFSGYTKEELSQNKNIREILIANGALEALTPSGNKMKGGKILEGERGCLITENKKNKACLVYATRIENPERILISLVNV